MLTTTLDGLWVLQAVSGIEQLCPELGLRPLLPRLDTAERALRHPITAELTAVGALGPAGDVDPMIREWLTVILRRDLTLLLQLHRPGPADPDTATRVSLCRFASWWVVLERCGRQVRLYPAGIATDRTRAAELVVGQVERLCGVTEAAPLRPVTLDAARLLDRVRDHDSLRDHLTAQRHDLNLDPDQLHILLQAADPQLSGQAGIVALQPGAGPERLAGMAIGDAAVALVDTPAGRICAASIDAGGRRYQVLSPGTRAVVADAILRLLDRMPAAGEWHSHRRTG